MNLPLRLVNAGAAAVLDFVLSFDAQVVSAEGVLFGPQFPEATIQVARASRSVGGVHRSWHANRG